MTTTRSRAVHQIISMDETRDQSRTRSEETHQKIMNDLFGIERLLRILAEQRGICLDDGSSKHETGEDIDASADLGGDPLATSGDQVPVDLEVQIQESTEAVVLPLPPLLVESSISETCFVNEPFQDEAPLASYTNSDGSSLHQSIDPIPVDHDVHIQESSEVVLQPLPAPLVVSSTCKVTFNSLQFYISSDSPSCNYRTSYDADSEKSVAAPIMNSLDNSCTQGVRENAPVKMIFYPLPEKPPDEYLNVIKWIHSNRELPYEVNCGKCPKVKMSLMAPEVPIGVWCSGEPPWPPDITRNLRYLNLVKVMIASENLPLHIPMEMLEKHKPCKVIRQHLVIKCIELFQLIAEDKEAYKMYLWTLWLWIIVPIDLYALDALATEWVQGIKSGIWLLSWFKGMRIIVTACRSVDVTYEKIHMKYTEVYMGLIVVLRGVSNIRMFAMLASRQEEGIAKMVRSTMYPESKSSCSTSAAITYIRGPSSAFVDIGHSSMQVCIAVYNKDQLNDCFGNELTRIMIATECTTRGAAFQCVILNPTFHVTDFKVREYFLFSILLAWNGAASDTQNTPTKNIQTTVVFPKRKPNMKSLTFYKSDTFIVGVISSIISELQVPAMIITYTFGPFQSTNSDMAKIEFADKAINNNGNVTGIKRKGEILMTVEQLRSHLGSLGVTGNLALQQMYTLSDGPKSRVAFATIIFKKPHIILLDEPSIHLDLDAVDALIQGLVLFQVGVLMISHDEHLISGSMDELWVVSDGSVTPFHGIFADYKKILQSGGLRGKRPLVLQPPAKISTYTIRSFQSSNDATTKVKMKVWLLRLRFILLVIEPETNAAKIVTADAPAGKLAHMSFVIALEEAIFVQTQYYKR